MFGYPWETRSIEKTHIGHVQRNNFANTTLVVTKGNFTKDN